jgi:tRNA G10  N-methylase Trm11
MSGSCQCQTSTFFFFFSLEISYSDSSVNFTSVEDYFNIHVFAKDASSKYNYAELELRDMKKPVRREKLAISPRLAKIMINLSQVKTSEKLVDPFCGVGVILQEALIQGINVIGIDKDKNAINGARENLKWGKFQKEKYLLLNRNSKKVKIPWANVLVSEPDLGEILKKIPIESFDEKVSRVLVGE